MVVPRTGIVDLTRELQADGRLEWDVPSGDWTILRLGYTPTGVKNHPAPAEGTGLECDKFSQEALDAHWAGFVQKVLDDLGPLAGEGKALNNVLIDSYEVGGQNWTPQFRSEFQKRRGYDPLLYLPTLDRPRGGQSRRCRNGFFGTCGGRSRICSLRITTAISRNFAINTG